MGELILKVENVSKKISGKAIISNVSFTISNGEVIGLIGPNGSGKTTLIRMITGLQKIDEGDIFIAGHHVKNDFTKAISHVGAIVETPQFYNELSGYRNLKLCANMYTDISERRIDSITELVGLKERIHDPVFTYSLGMKQRLGIAQAVLHQPKLLILDEPTNGLDPEGIHDLRNHIRYLSKNEGISVLISTHILSEVEHLCDRITMINQGSVIESKTLSKGMQEGLLRIEVDDIESAVRILNNEYEVTIEEDKYLILTVNKDSIPNLNRLLVENRIKVYHLAFGHNQLERSFLRKLAEMEER